MWFKQGLRLLLVVLAITMVFWAVTGVLGIGFEPLRFGVSLTGCAVGMFLFYRFRKPRP